MKSSDLRGSQERAIDLYGKYRKVRMRMMLSIKLTPRSGNEEPLNKIVN